MRNTDHEIHRRNRMQRLFALLMPALLLAASSGGCSSDADGTVTVIAQNRFQAEVPSGWQVVLPDTPSPDDIPPPVLVTGPKDGDSGLAVFNEQASSDVAGAFEKWAGQLVDAELSEPTLTHSGGRIQSVASGTRFDRTRDKSVGIVLAVVGLEDPPGSLWVIQCDLGDLKAAECERFIARLRPIPK